MKTDAQSLLLLGSGVAFLAYFVVRLVLPSLGRDPAHRAARARLRDAVRQAGDRSAPAVARAAALRQAAQLALEQLRRPALAASYARRAERLDPTDEHAVDLWVGALRAGGRFRALERLLWRRLTDDSIGAAGHDRALSELVALYDGPLRRSEVAEGLRRLSRIAPRS